MLSGIRLRSFNQGTHQIRIPSIRPRKAFADEVDIQAVAYIEIDIRQQSTFRIAGLWRLQFENHAFSTGLFRQIFRGTLARNDAQQMHFHFQLIEYEIALSGDVDDLKLTGIAAGPIVAVITEAA